MVGENVEKLVFTEYTKISTIKFDTPYYRAGEIAEGNVQKIVVTKDGDLYFDDVRQPVKVIVTGTLIVGMNENEGEDSIALLTSLDGTYITNMDSSGGDYYLNDYSHEHIHEEMILVGTKSTHGRIPCCDIVITDHVMTNEYLKVDGLDIQGKLHYSCECGYNYTDEKTLSDYTWTEIDALASAGLNSNVLKNTFGIQVGQSKDSNVLFDIENQYNGWVFSGRAGTQMPYRTQFNEEMHTNGGYAYSALAEYINDCYYSITDEELKSVIREVEVLCNDNKYGNLSIHKYNAYMFLPSLSEIRCVDWIDNAVFKEYYSAEGAAFEYNNFSTKFTNIYLLRTVLANNDKSVFVYNTFGTEDALQSYLPFTYGIYYNDAVLVPLFVVGDNGHVHQFSNNAINIALRNQSNCKYPKTYFASCSCGKLNVEETFVVGSITPSKHLYSPSNAGNATQCQYYACCGETANSEHTFSQSTVIQAALCETPGIQKLTCKCGYSYETEIAPTGHSGSLVFGGTENAHQKYSVCGCAANANHTFGDAHIATAPGLNISGQTIRECDCGYYLVVSPKTVNNYTWTELQSMSQLRLSNNEYEKIYGLKVGQEKDNTYVLVDIDGNDYDGFVFMYDTGLDMQMNAGTVNSPSGKSNSYVYADLNKYLNEDLLNDMYNDLSRRELVESMKYISVKCTVATYDRVRWDTAGIYAFIPSMKEVGWVNNYAVSNYTANIESEGECFDYFIKDNGEEAKQLRMSICSDDWWLRTCDGTTTPHGWFSNVHKGDAGPWTMDTYTNSVVACFVI